MECVELRVKDIDLETREIRVRDGKGRKDRVTMLPQVAVEPLRLQLTQARGLHVRDLESGYDIRTIQELLGHRDVSTTMISTRTC